MKKSLLLSSLSFCMMASFAQQADPSKYGSLITGTELKKHLSIIASDAMEGRETGTEGQRKAAAYIEGQFKSMGLTSAAKLNGYQQYYPLYQDSMISSKLTIGDSALEFGKDYLASASLNQTGTFKGSKLVFVGYGIEDSLYTDYKDADVKGKIVVFFYGEPKKDTVFVISGKRRGSEWSYPGLSKKLALAAKKGAVGALVINPLLETFPSRTVDNAKKSNLVFTSIASDEKTIDYAVLSHAYAKKLLGADFDSLLKQAKNYRLFTPSIKIKNTKVDFAYNKNRTTVNASNVVGVIEGTDKKDEYVFLTGHYDHLGKHDGKIYYGADDDGSGTCAVITMAEAFAKAKADGIKPRRTLVFMTVSGEEKGLWGSEYYSDHPIFSLDSTSADLNTDMVGRIDTERKKDDTTNYVYVIGHNKLSTDLAKINEGMNEKYTKLTLDYMFDDPNDPNRIYYRSDHFNFARKGVPILFFYDGMLKADYHQPTDTVDKINWDLYEKRVRMIFYTAWEIANRDDMLKRDIPL